MKVLIIATLCLLAPLSAYLQTKNFEVEGADDQIAVIRTTSTGNSYAGIDLLRGNAFSATDWRIANVGGRLQIIQAVNEFSTPGDVRATIGTNGTMTLFGGGNAVLGNGSGVMVLGDPDGENLALDQNGIIARNGALADELLLQTGPGMGDTYLNNLSGDVGIGTIVPGAKLSVQNEGWQLHLKNTEDNDSDWYVGSSRSSWSVGADKLVISPTSASSAAMLVLDKTNNTISARSNRVIQVEDPIDDRDAVNLRTLASEASRLPRPRDLSPAAPSNIIGYAACATYCRELDQIQADDWKIPSMDELSYWAGVSGYTGYFWVTDASSSAYAFDGAAMAIESYRLRLSMRLSDGNLDATTNPNATSFRCVCVR